jgi:dTDP-4-dehydrorhamnose reductase
VLKQHDVTALDIGEIDITSTDSINAAFAGYQPDVIINCAAYVRVDDCETNKDTAFKVNAIGSRNIAVKAQELNAKLVFISTDYVFGGDNTRTIPYTEFDKPDPLSVYGISKLAGEDYVRHLCNTYFIVRVSGLFGVAGSSGKGGNFIETMIKMAKEKPQLQVINDQIFSPTYTLDTAKKIGQIINTACYGIYHITNNGTCSWYDLTVEILHQLGLKTPVKPVSSIEYKQPAKRPGYSVLGHYQLSLQGWDDLRSWQDALKDYLWQKGHLR